MLVDTVKDWIAQSKNNSYITSIDESLYQIRVINPNIYQYYIDADEALYVQLYNTFEKWPASKTLVVFGIESNKSDFSKIQKITHSANNTFLSKKSMFAEAVSYNSYDFVLLRQI